jgi:hypothetical protein
MAESVRIDLEDIYGVGLVPGILGLQRDLGPDSARTDEEKEIIRLYLRHTIKSKKR